jgi:arabinogalactan endo-1,4-beta-galactosidase
VRFRSESVMAVLALALFLAVPARLGAAPAADREAFVLGADLSFLPQEEAGGAVYRDAAGEADACAILQRHGFGWVRLRLWHHPRDGHSDLAEVLAMARRARDRRMSILLDLHYSDTWADPGHQSPPAAWNGLPPAALEDSVYRWTRDVVTLLVAQDTPPAMVQLGNEISGGMLWEAGRLRGASPDPGRWRALGRLLCAGARGVRDGAPHRTVRIMLHYDRGGDAGGSRAFFAGARAAGVPFDVIGLSYYPWWHGTLDALSATVGELARRFDRDVVVVEVSYPWTLVPLDGIHDLVGLPSQLLPGFPATPPGQAAFLRRVAEIVRSAPDGHGRGLFLWAPDWVSAPRFGSAGENLALFDGAGRLLPAADSLAAAARAPLP